MSERIERIEIEGRPDVFVRLPAGEARVVAGVDGVVEVVMVGRDTVLDRFTVTRRGGQVVVEPQSGRMGRWSAVDVEIRVGADAAIHTRLAAGDVIVTTPIDVLVVEAGSGDVTAQVVQTDARIKTASGDVSVVEVGRRLDAAAASGMIRVETVGGNVNAKTASGDISLGAVTGSVVAHSASGDVEVARFDGDGFEAKTLAGDVRIGVVPGRTFSVDFSSLSGEVITDFPVSSGGSTRGSTRLSVKTMSGDIVVKPAR